MSFLILLGSIGVDQFVNSLFNIVHQQHMQYGFFTVKVLINSSLGYLSLFSYLVYTCLMVTEFAKQVLSRPLYTIFNFIGFHPQLYTFISKGVSLTPYILKDLVAGALTGPPSVNENFAPLQGSVTVNALSSITTAHSFSG